MQRNSLQTRLSSFVEELIDQGINLEQASKEFERQFLIASIRRYDGILSRSAKAMGMHRNTLRNRLDRLGITARDYAPKTTRSPKTARSRTSGPPKTVSSLRR